MGGRLLSKPAALLTSLYMSQEICVFCTEKQVSAC